MAKILSNERIVEYSTEFKVRVVKLTESLDVTTADIAEIMGLHPVMVYRWRQEYREGKIIEQPSRRISMSKPSATPPLSMSEKDIKKLLKENDKLKKENELLKKWDAYLKDQRRKDSNS